MNWFLVFVIPLLALLPISPTHARPTPPPLTRIIRLPAELAERENQFSGLCTYRGQLLLLSESRLQEQAEAKVYGLALADLDQQLAGSTAPLPFRKYAIRGLAEARARIDGTGPIYEGLEGLTMLRDTAYFSIETVTAAPNCYLVRGVLDQARSVIQLDSSYLVTLPKPRLPDGTVAYNAGFEALATYRHRELLALFEYNYLPRGNAALALRNGRQRPVALPPLPFRVTDLEPAGRRRFTAINYFFNGASDAVYRMAPPDPNARLIQDSTGRYQSYNRLISLRYTRRGISWKPLLTLPVEYQTYNWEGLAAYKRGYFLINDKYGPSGQSTLLYLRRR
ncbi:hypothetical protein [Hymenobacter actinosclerus]|uniref:Uncharacterized protein n=1 Tax=Hymenobacter actinosclerus TaxID=82805 RepID=A0A1I0GVW7_9BACT|nr:hypothetical protein [Hymenobacter actinosclerus]SET74582.1 hypothetical protein SAMN04487998_2582 [Hymenobacter actinosclerus]